MFENMMVNTSLEFKQAMKLLETYTFEDFKESTENWMKSGRQCWFVCGNYDAEEAKSLVKKSQDLLKLRAIRIEDLPEVRSILIEEGRSFIVEKDLVDKTNENSCLITYYEVGARDSDDLKMSLTNSVMMQMLSEPFFNELRTQQ